MLVFAFWLEFSFKGSVNLKIKAIYASTYLHRRQGFYSDVILLLSVYMEHEN